MNLTAEQRGDVKPEAKSEDQKLADGLATTTASIDSKVLEDDKEAKQRKLQEEYAKAYYVALMQRQQDAMTGSLGNSDAMAGALPVFTLSTSNQRVMVHMQVLYSGLLKRILLTSPRWKELPDRGFLLGAAGLPIFGVIKYSSS
ncbi:hypothetical protein GOP47_0004077 [Adiantum capillus-veneris]|uniref:Uncharacterized protein n=1 Tax=Adiantum capillus-veneris TaxID=13818 RepID=A0A9D4V6X0_ADICA|nr:hypothetical protein GOP47_0004077 [Adiantum capillus-veneris]